MSHQDARTAGARLKRAVDFDTDRVRGAGKGDDVVHVVIYGDYLCPYCRGLLHLLTQLRAKLGNSLAFVFRHLPNERAHPGAERLARAAEAAGAQGRFWEMHDWLFEQHPPIGTEQILAFARELGLDVDQFERDLDGEQAHACVRDHVSEGRACGITSTPTLYIDGVRYDDAWDFHSLLEALRKPVAVQVQRSARAFANLPASAGLVLLLAAVAALICANTPVAPFYRALMEANFVIGPAGGGISMAVATWMSEGLLSIFFLLVGLELRHELTAGALTDPRAAVLPVVAAIGGVAVPAAIFLAFASPSTATGWSVPTATDIAFVIGILALLGTRVSAALRVFVAALAVVDGILSALILGFFYAHAIDASWLLAGVAATALLFAFNGARVYAGWPYAVVACALWLALHAGGVHAALAGVILAAALPTRPPATAGPLLAQAATALHELETVERGSGQEAERHGHAHQHPNRDSAGRSLAAVSARLLSPAERIQRAVEPWSAYLILPLFAFSATGVDLFVELQSSEDIRIFLGVVVGLVFGKPAGILLASWLAIKAGIGTAPADTTWRALCGAACLCGVGMTVALLMADEANPIAAYSQIAKIGVLVGSVFAAALGTLVIRGDAGKRPKPVA